MPDSAIPAARRLAARANTPGTLAILIFASVSLALLGLHANRVVFSNDEGIILDAANRMLHRQALYRDFFAYMSPGSYWLQEAAFRVCGVTLLAGRLPVILDFALECALLFWLTARLSSKAAAGAVTALFFAFQASKPDFLLAQHRMDSAALSLAAIALCWQGSQLRRAWCWIAGGVLIVAASACTPSVALLAPVVLVWLLAERPLRHFVIPYICGLSIGAILFAARLAAGGTLFAFLDQMRWLHTHYSSVNIMPYGSIVGGYLAALSASNGIAVSCLALPAILPLFALAAWGLLLCLRRPERRWAAGHAIPFLLACAAALVLSTYPRADVAHLAFIAALPAILTAVWIARYAPRWLNLGIFAILAICAGLFLVSAANRIRTEITVATPVGRLQLAPPDAGPLSALLNTVRPGDALYAHPYMPLLYFLTQGQNPTRYSYLQPGLMTRDEELAALAALRRSPPKWLLYLPLSRAEFLRVFPHAGQLDHRFPSIEEWRERQYVPVEPPVIVAGYRLYARKPGLEPAIKRYSAPSFPASATAE